MYGRSTPPNEIVRSSRPGVAGRAHAGSVVVGDAVVVGAPIVVVGAAVPPSSESSPHAPSASAHRSATAACFRMEIPPIPVAVTGDDVQMEYFATGVA